MDKVEGKVVNSVVEDLVLAVHEGLLLVEEAGNYLRGQLGIPKKEPVTTSEPTSPADAPVDPVVPEGQAVDPNAAAADAPSDHPTDQPVA